MANTLQMRVKPKERHQIELVEELCGAPNTSVLLRTLIHDYLKRELAEETERAESTAVQLKALESLVVKEYGEDEKTWPEAMKSQVDHKRDGLKRLESNVKRIRAALE